MTKQVQRRRGTATQHTSFTGAEGELSVNTTNKSVHVHDGSTAGGFEAARKDLDNVSSASVLAAAGISATITEVNYIDGVTSAIQTQLNAKAGLNNTTFTGTTSATTVAASGDALVTGVLTTTAASVSNGGGQFNGTIQVGGNTDGHDVKFFGNGSGKFMQWDESADSLLISGTTLTTGAIQVGTDGAGHDVKLFGDTSGAYMQWDESTDDLILGGAAGLSVNSAALVTGVLTTTAATVFNGGFASNASSGIAGNVSSATLFSGFAGLRIHNANGSSHGVSSEIDFTAGTTSTTNRGAAIGSVFTSAANGNDLYFATNGGNVGSSNTLTERMRITSAGNVGIGTDVPIHVLDVDAIATGAIPTNADIGASNANQNYFGFHNSSNSATFTGLALETRTSGASRWLIANEWQSTYLGDLVFRVRDGGSSSSEVLRIASNGTLSTNGVINIKDGGNEFLRISESSGDAVIQSTVQNKKIFFSGDNNGGGVNALILDMSEAGAATFSSNVGIGTAASNPYGFDRILQIHGTNSAILRFTGSTYGVGANDGPYIGMSYGGFEITNPRSSYTRFTMGSAEAMRIDANGNLGINNSGPNEKLHINGNIHLELGSNSPSNGATLGDIKFGARVDNTVTAIIRAIAGDNTNGTDGQLTFFTADNTASAAAAERMRIDASGNLGIGTDAPSSYSATELVVAAADEGGITLAASATSHKQNIYFADGTSGSAAKRGNLSYDHNLDQLSMGTAGGNARFVMDTTGAVTILGNLVIGTDGKGINFSAQTQSGSTTVSEILDHYEEGTTAPSVSGGHFDMASGTIGSYTRVGNIVNFQAKLIFPSNSNSNEARITLPFVVSTRSSYFPSGANGPNGTAAASHCLGIGGQSYIVFQPTTGATTSTLANLSSANVNVNLTYQTTP